MKITAENLEVTSWHLTAVFAMLLVVLEFRMQAIDAALALLRCVGVCITSSWSFCRLPLMKPDGLLLLRFRTAAAARACDSKLTRL